MPIDFELDSADEDGSIYEYAARSTLALYGDFVKGTPDSVLAVISEHELHVEALQALKASAERLGYGQEGCAWITMRPTPSDKLGPQDLKMILEGVDPIAVIATDAFSTHSINSAYDVNVKMNNADIVNGRPFVSLGDFVLMLKDNDSKQKAWRLMKTLKLD